MVYLRDNEANFDTKAKNWISPLHIAINGDDQRIVDLILSMTTATHLDKGLDFDLIRENKDKVEKFLRKITLHDSLSNSGMSALPSVGDFRSDDLEEEEFFNNMYSLLSSEQESERVLEALANHPKVVELVIIQKSMEEEEAERRDFMMRRRRRRNYELKKKKFQMAGAGSNSSPRESSHYEELQTDSAISKKFNFNGSQDQVKLIQKNVRGWLLRRQFHDTKFAVKILQSRKIVLLKILRN